jgi:hypothetical protein
MYQSRGVVEVEVVVLKEELKSNLERGGYCLSGINGAMKHRYFNHGSTK